MFRHGIQEVVGCSRPEAAAPPQDERADLRRPPTLFDPLRLGPQPLPLVRTIPIGSTRFFNSPPFGRLFSFLVPPPLISPSVVRGPEGRGAPRAPPVIRRPRGSDARSVMRCSHSVSEHQLLWMGFEVELALEVGNPVVGHVVPEFGTINGTRPLR